MEKMQAALVLAQQRSSPFDLVQTTIFATTLYRLCRHMVDLQMMAEVTVQPRSKRFHTG